MSNRLMLALLCTFAGVAACGDEEDAVADSGAEEEHEHAGPQTGAVCPDESTLTYDTFGRDFVESYCTRCHSSTLAAGQRMSAPSDHNFNTLELVRENADHINEVAAAGPLAVNSFMPLTDPKPSLAEREQLGEWLACGAP